MSSLEPVQHGCYTYMQLGKKAFPPENHFLQQKVSLYLISLSIQDKPPGFPLP